jgi:hypothetical protein
MVRKTALLLAILLALCSCSFFTASLFPGYLAQAELGFDLSRQVDALLAGRSNPLRAELFVLRNNSTGEEFACLLLVVDYTPDRALFVVTPEGHLLQRNEPGLNGLHLTAADGRFVIGQVAYDPVTFTFAADLSVTPYQIWPEDTWKPAVSDGSSNFLFDVIWSTTLNYYEYKNDWSGRGSTPYALSLSSSYSNYELTRVFKDPDASGAEIILALRTSSGTGESAVVVRTPQAGYAGPSPTLCVPVVDCYPHTTISGDELDTRQVFYTRKGIAAVSYKGLLTLYDFNGNELSSMSLGQRKDLRFAFNLDGTHFYCFNLDDRRLYKGETGW